MKTEKSPAVANPARDGTPGCFVSTLFVDLDFGDQIKSPALESASKTGHPNSKSFKAQPTRPKFDRPSKPRRKLAVNMLLRPGI